MGQGKDPKPSQKAGVGSQDQKADEALESNLSSKDTRSPGSEYEENKAKGSSRGPKASSQVGLLPVSGSGGFTERIPRLSRERHGMEGHGLERRKLFR